jgi:hypothetical protein
MGVKTPMVLRPPTMSFVVVRRSGDASRPWAAKQRRCPPERWKPRFGVVAVAVAEVANAAMRVNVEDELLRAAAAAAAAQIDVVMRGALMSPTMPAKRESGSGSGSERNALGKSMMVASSEFFFFDFRPCDCFFFLFANQ